MDSDRQYQHALKIWEADAAFRANVQSVRSITRQREPVEYSMNGKKYSVAPTPRGMALVQMFVAMVEMSPRVSVPPIVAGEPEDEKATRIERFMRGVRRATKFGVIHPDDAFWLNYAESGRGILQLQFDLDLAKQRAFPFRRHAIDPTCFAFRANDNGLLCAVVHQERDALELYDELAGAYERVKNNAPQWHIPDILQRAYDEYQSFPVRVLKYFDRAREYMWVNQEPVWRFEDEPGRPHLMGRAPFDVGFCMPMTGERGDEWAQGIVKTVLGNLRNEARMLDKAYLGFDLFFMPQVAIQETNKRLFFEQMVPGGQGYENVEQYTIANPQVNAPMMEQLLTKNNRDISIGSLSETTLNGEIPPVSGFLFTQANSAEQRKNMRLLDSGTNAYQAHYNLMLNRIEYFANRERAEELCATAEERENYLKSFTTFSPALSKPNARIQQAVTLNSESVRGYTVVEVDFKPEPPQDDNAKFQRAQLVKPFMPQEWIDREVLKVESPEQVAQWRREEALMQDPEWRAMILAKWKKDKLRTDRELASEYAEHQLAALPPAQAQLAHEALAQGYSVEQAMAAVERIFGLRARGANVQPQTVLQGQADSEAGMASAEFVSPALMGQVPVPPTEWSG